MNGFVTAFDDHVGLGEVQSDDGSVFPFHCTQIVDGTRSVDVDAKVTFRIVTERPKGPEAYDIVKV